MAFLNYTVMLRTKQIIGYNVSRTTSLYSNTNANSDGHCDSYSYTNPNRNSCSDHAHSLRE